ncbi:heavy-metal-associated domain-containing protein [Halomarina litorea]|uniref:heavy-metal-associated domain-containing protein n=1 Tax=Halomarina litorea TaxID=2961595 RepID=UPI0020C5A25C|nr:heavy metal-associated domain-containing protein [Halomarina sp. BCD28]
MDERTFRVERMGCTGCERSVETALRRVDGVETVDADFHTRTVAVTVDEHVDEATLLTAIEHTGYEATPANPESA